MNHCEKGKGQAKAVAYGFRWRIVSGVIVVCVGSGELVDELLGDEGVGHLKSG